MKIPFAAAFVILAVGAAIGWQDRGKLVDARTRHEKLKSEAAALGIPVKNGGGREAGTGGHAGKRERDNSNKEAEAKKMAADFIAFAREMEEAEKTGGEFDQGKRKRVMEMINRIASLDSSQLKVMIAEIRDAKDLKEETRDGIIGFSLVTMAGEHPQAALQFFTESQDLIGSQDMGEHAVSTALMNWAKTDPTGAAEWLKKNGEKFPEMITDETKTALIQGATASGPQFAFGMIRELGLEEPEDAIKGIMGMARTAEERTANLTALRAYLAQEQDEETRKDLTSEGMSTLGRNMARGGIEETGKWLEGAKLSQDELAGFAKGLPGSIKESETAQWVQWTAEHVPAETAGRTIRQMVSSWTRNDYRAAGTWLAAAPEGPAKGPAVRAYAETVAQYEPETAAQWAMTLPQGEERSETLENIHKRWPKKTDEDKAAAAAFAEEHGIKR